MRLRFLAAIAAFAAFSVSGESARAHGYEDFVRGDSNIDGTVDISDAVYTLAYLFSGGVASPPCLEALNANDDGPIDLSDAIFTLTFLFLTGATIPAPYPDPGQDGGENPLGCDRYGPVHEGAIIADHTRTDLSGINLTWLAEAKANFKIFYGHTSHGSQILSGLSAMRDATYDYNNGAGTLSIQETGGDLGNPDFREWATTTREKLNEPTNDRNVVMWSWCGQASWATEENIATDYLGQMDELEEEFPEVKFVYMTGHLDGSGVDGNLNRRNEQIRTFCKENGKTLFDFADIESYDPEGNYYLDRGANDNCDYDGGNWAQEWCAQHPGECSSCDCAHSQSLNCDRKARVFWWMVTEMAIPQVP
jgi:hypothetical protein